MLRKKLFAKQSIQSVIDQSGEQGGMVRHLGPIQLIALGVGAIIGAGLFVLTGQAAAEYAGPGVIFSFGIAAFICIFSALCYAEFASMVPGSGGAYSYAYVTLGELAAWIIGWGLTLEYLFSCATVSVGFSSYFTSLMSDFGWNISKLWAGAPIAYDAATGWSRTGSLINLPAVILVAGIGLMVAIGIKAAALFNNIMVFIKVGIILLFIAIGFGYINMENLTPLIPPNTGIFGEFGWSGIFRGAGLAFFAFIGFDSLATLGQEAKNPQKDMPIGMIGSLMICSLIYMIVAIVLCGIVSYKLLGVADPFAVAINSLGAKYLWFRFVIKIAIIAGLTSVVLVMLLGQSRIFYAMSRDGLLPPFMGKIHRKYKTPFLNTIIVAIAAIVLCGIFPVGILGQLTVMGALIAFALVCFGVLMLRYTQPKIKRPFKVPFVPYVPAIGCLSCLIQMVLMPGVVWIQMVIWMILGFLIYFLYSIRHSKIHR